MKKLNTPFGTMYIDSWEERKRPERDRIVIYDSRKEFLDYFSLDYFYDGYGPEYDSGEEAYAEGTYDDLCKMLEMGAEEKTFHDFMDWLGVAFLYAGDNAEEAAKALSDGCPEDLEPDELETNEYVNHVGNNYLVVTE